MGVKQVKEKVGRVLQKYQHDNSVLVDILHDIQAEIGYLPKDVLEETSRALDVPLSRVYSVATFFKAFSLEPRGRHLINVCMGTACHVRGAVKVMEKVEQTLGIKTGETTADLKFTLETVNCVGACALGPMIIIGEDYHGEMTPDAVSSMLENYT
jgi:NADH-quinone oxidoreductase subunit E